jgi:hypothetical protein
MAVTEHAQFKRLRSGALVKVFPAGGLPEPAASLGAGYAALVALADAVVEKSAAIQGDPNLSATGRKAALKAWFRQEAVPQLKRAGDAKAQVADRLAALKASMSTSEIDKGDLAGALLRQEIRAWLRGMEPAQRAGLLAVAPADQIAAAILEAPAELSGVTPNQKAALQEDALARANPEQVLAIRIAEEAGEAVESAEQAAMATLRDAVGLTAAELDEALGSPTLVERIRAKLVADAPAGDSA